MHKIWVFFSFLLATSFVQAQSNLIFSIPRDYNIKVYIANYNSTKPQAWQVKFQNIPEGKYEVVVTVSKSDNSFQRTENFSLDIERGYETTYFIYPSNNRLECKIANYYTLDQVYGKNADNQKSADSKERLEAYNGKPVLNQKDFYSFWEAAKTRTYGSDIIEFLKKQMPRFYFYTDDVIYLVGY
jgi:hypothetical protein